jgi:hypothetical protein
MDFRICVFGAAHQDRGRVDQSPNALNLRLLLAAQRARPDPGPVAIDPKRTSFEASNDEIGDLAEYVQLPAAHKVEHDRPNKRFNSPAYNRVSRIFPNAAERRSMPYVALTATESSRGAGQSPSRPRRRNARLVAVQSSIASETQ